MEVHFGYFGKSVKERLKSLKLLQSKFKFKLHHSSTDNNNTIDSINNNNNNNNIMFVCSVLTYQGLNLAAGKKTPVILLPMTYFDLRVK